MPSSPSSVTCGSATKICSRRVERLQESEPALEPCAGGTRPALQHVHMRLHGARGEHKDRIVRRGRQRLGSFRHCKRLGILRAQAKHEPEPCSNSRASDAAGRRQAASTHAGRRSSLRARTPSS